jgi:hypothetical protein
MRGAFALLLILLAVGMLYYAFTGTNPWEKVKAAGSTLKAQTTTTTKG